MGHFPVRYVTNYQRVHFEKTQPRSSHMVYRYGLWSSHRPTVIIKDSVHAHYMDININYIYTYAFKWIDDYPPIWVNLIQILTMAHIFPDSFISSQHAMQSASAALTRTCDCEMVQEEVQLGQTFSILHFTAGLRKTWIQYNGGKTITTIVNHSQTGGLLLF